MICRFHYPLFLIDVKIRYDVVLFNNYTGVRHATGNTRRYQAELFENVENDIYVFSPNIQLMKELNVRFWH